MTERNIKTRLVKKTSRFTRVCTNCNAEIPPGEIYHQEEGVTEHLHSLIARQFCNKCYAKYGERILLSGKKIM
ncbi:MAG: hypothetical protein DRN05_03435 [Thermoplasmata archaeon]|nr:MAG: hypothetical protein DRN05_03435 [Thermoplasmata archaeon]